MAGHGGARPGAGRKAKADKFAPEIDAAERRIADRLPQILEKIEKLAAGGLVEVTRKHQPAMMVTTKDVVHDALGNPKNVVIRLFPKETDPKKMVVVEETRKTLLPDRAAGIYLLDRILGKPLQAIEVSDADSAEADDGADLRALTSEELDTLHGWLKKAEPGTGNNDVGNPDAPAGGSGEMPAQIL